MKESAATEKMEKAAFIIFLKGEDLLNMMFDVHKEKEELLLKMPQAKGRFSPLKESSMKFQRHLLDSGQSSWES